MNEGNTSISVSFKTLFLIAIKLIQLFTDIAGLKIAGSFYVSRKYLALSGLLYTYKSKIIKKTNEYFCNIRTESSLPALDRIQNHVGTHAGG